MLPRDVDLTLKMDFNNRETEPKSIKLEKTKKDESYKRYNEYENKTYSSTTSLESSNDNFFTATTQSTTTTSLSTRVGLVFDRLYGNRIIKKEERICWRKLFKDPNVYGESSCSSYEEMQDRVKNYNFPMGSKYDRLKIHYKKLRDMEDFGAGFYCDCCGKKLNKRNCLAHYYTLCQECNKAISERISSIKL